MNRQLGASLIIFTGACLFLAGGVWAQETPASFALTPLQDLAVTANTGEKPQSKVWRHDDRWWAVLPSATGTKLWRLDDGAWRETLHLSDLTGTKSDVRALENTAHVLLHKGEDSELVSIEYDMARRAYRPWSARPDAVPIPLPSAETATIDVDASGRMWLAYADETEVQVQWSDAPYDTWSAPLTLASGIKPDDICAVAAFPDGAVGVLWSNQKAKRFGFRMHPRGASPDRWSANEVPASASALPWAGGMADDHLNFAIASDGTLYAAVKTSYDTEGYPLVALLVRRPYGTWDRLYSLDDEGSRGIVLLDEQKGRLMLAYTSYRDNAMVCRISNTSLISFGPRHTLIQGEVAINNATSTKQSIHGDAVILAAEPVAVRGVQVKW